MTQREHDLEQALTTAQASNRSLRDALKRHRLRVQLVAGWAAMMTTVAIAALIRPLVDFGISALPYIALQLLIVWLAMGVTAVARQL